MEAQAGGEFNPCAAAGWALDQYSEANPAGALCNRNFYPEVPPRPAAPDLILVS